MTLSPATIRDLRWEELRDRLAGPRETVWAWLFAHGPATTTAIAEGTGIGLLTVRPRVSELCAWGFAECVGRNPQGGIYQAVTIATARARHEENCRESQLKFTL